MRSRRRPLLLINRSLRVSVVCTAVNGCPFGKVSPLSSDTSAFQEPSPTPKRPYLYSDLVDCMIVGLAVSLGIMAIRDLIRVFRNDG